MTLVKHIQPARPFGNLIDEWFQEFPGLLRETGNFGKTPVNIVENKDGYHLEVNAPGRNKEDFKVQVDKNLLTISYEHKEEAASEDLKQIRREFSAYSFSRSFSLDEKIDAANIRAKYENGLLKVFVPRKEEVKVEPQSIHIQ
ncbi:MAG: Hsp20/alpha crystallin family protein [Flavihumibacter sp.]